jgi:hypothetical protein
MTSGNGAERSGEEPAADESLHEPHKGSTEDSDDGADTTVDPAPAGAERPRAGRRKAGVEYRPV